MSEHDSGGIDHVSLDLNIEGYDATATIHATALKEYIRRHEVLEEVQLNGFGGWDFSRFVSVEVDPTEEKWAELADRSLNTESDP